LETAAEGLDPLADAYEAKAWKATAHGNLWIEADAIVGYRATNGVFFFPNPDVYCGGFGMAPDVRQRLLYDSVKCYRNPRR
jgi:hypothetical protein